MTVQPKYFIDGFCLTQIITPVPDIRMYGGIRYEVVQKCSSIEEAKQECDRLNKEYVKQLQNSL